MGFVGTAVVYLILGLVVAAALLLREPRGLGRAALAVPFWPLIAPLLFAGPALAAAPAGARVEALQARLLEGLGGLSGVAEEVLAPEVARVRGLAGAVAQLEQRLAEMDALLRTPEFDLAQAQGLLAELGRRGAGEGDPRLESVRARLRNVERLRQMRARTAESLERVLLKLEEMCSQLQLLRFAGGAEAEVVRLLKEISESVEEVTEGLLAGPGDERAAVLPLRPARP